MAGLFQVLRGEADGTFRRAEVVKGTDGEPLIIPYRVDSGQVLRDEDLKGPQSCTRIWVDDVNSDGKLDLLVGEMNSHYWEIRRPVS